MDSINEEILQEENKGGNPKFAVVQIGEILLRQLYILKSQWRLVWRSYRGGHFAVKVDDRVVSQGVVRKESAARF